jgi:hypothetical protein
MQRKSETPESHHVEHKVVDIGVAERATRVRLQAIAQRHSYHVNNVCK